MKLYERDIYNNLENTASDKYLRNKIRISTIYWCDYRSGVSVNVALFRLLDYSTLSEEKRYVAISPNSFELSASGVPVLHPSQTLRLRTRRALQNVALRCMHTHPHHTEKISHKGFQCCTS